MTQYCYVMTDGSNNGTRVTATAYTSRQTTSFATIGVANYYASIYDALLYNTLVDGDEIICANTHNKDYAEYKEINFGAASLALYSVLYTDLTTYNAGAKESTSDTYLGLSVSSNNIIYSTGISYTIDDPSGTAVQFLTDNANFHIDDCTIGINRTIPLDHDLKGNGSTLTYKNTTFAFNQIGQFITVGDGVTLDFNECTFDYNSLVATKVFSITASGTVISLQNSNLLGIGTSATLIDGISYTDDYVNVTMNRCKLPTSMVVCGSVMRSPAQWIDVYSCDTGNGYHYFEYRRFEGIASESTLVYRTGGATYDGTNGFSAEFIPTSEVIEYTNPLRIELGNYEIDLTSGAVLTFHILINDETAQATALKNSECWIEVSYPDATDNALGKVVSTIAVTILTTPATLTASTASWTGEGTFTRKQQIAVTLPTSMSNAPVSVSLCLAKDITAENANEMFVCPNPVIT